MWSHVLVTLLAQRFVNLSTLPHLPLTQPTPLERLDVLCDDTGSDLWVKRDDLSAPLYGGNKVRKLEFLLADAKSRGHKTILTTGAIGSHHVLATSLFGARWGFDVEAVVMPQPWSDHVEENLRGMLAAGASLHLVPHWSLAPVQVAKRLASHALREPGAYWIPHGGSSALGTVGYVEGALEFGAQLNGKEFDAVVAPLGSGGTCAGLAIGLAALGLTTRVLAVRATPKATSHPRIIRRLVKQTVALLREYDKSFPDVSKSAVRLLEFDHDYFPPGYGASNAATDSALDRARRAGLELDATYTGKAFASFLRRAARKSGQRLVFWNTLSSADLSGVLSSFAGELPKAFSELKNGA